jgi:dTMP kinase
MNQFSFEPGKAFYGVPLPTVNPQDIHGRLFALEGVTGAGCQTQTNLVKEQLERAGHSAVVCRSGQSELVRNELTKARQGNLIKRRALFLIRVTDLFDQLEKVAIPALHAGCIVLMDRYIFTLIAGAMVRNLDPAWAETVLAPALVPDRVFMLDIPPVLAAQRILQREQTMEHWDAGHDFRSSSNLYQDFIDYQQSIYDKMMEYVEPYDFELIDGNREQGRIADEISQSILSYFD